MKIEIYDAMPVGSDGRFVPAAETKIEADGAVHFKNMQRSASIEGIVLNTSHGVFRVELALPSNVEPSENLVVTDIPGMGEGGTGRLEGEPLR